ncbi:hypothetical protein JST97_10510 [bacterium]|nr:hypothetical protein [bacterium]
MTVYWLFLAVLVWGSRMTGMPFLQQAELLLDPQQFVQCTYLAGMLGLLSLLVLTRLFPSSPSRLASFFGVTAYYLLIPGWERLLVAPLPQEFGDFLMLLACWMILRGRVGGFAGGLALLLGAGRMGWLNTPGFVSLALAGLVYLVTLRLFGSQAWRSLPAPPRAALAFVLAYALFLGGELELNRTLIVPFQRETAAFPLRLTAPDLSWMVAHDWRRLGMSADDAATIHWLASQPRTTAVVYTPGEPFESAQTFRIYEALSHNLIWTGWKDGQPNWGLNWIRQGGPWGGCGVDLVVVRGSEPKEATAFHQGSICVYRNRGVPSGEQSARSLVLQSDGQPGGQADCLVSASGPVIAAEEGQLPYLVLQPGSNPFRLPWQCRASSMKISGGLGMQLPSLSFEAAWSGLRVTDLDQERKMGCGSVTPLRFNLHNSGGSVVDLSGIRGVQLLSHFAAVQPVLPLRGLLKPGESILLEVPWTSPPRPVHGQLKFFWVDAQGQNRQVGLVPVRSWYRVPPAQYYGLGP